ncbi:serine hydrolase domain-containing protein [Conyzicola sp.]|uniref:serine hydrolase domain-containing protein n=1 Tax=Conyzicola sp. TaxID=1969404 RepID=UPI0039893224
MTLPRSTPEAQGVSSAAIVRFVDALERNLHEVHSMMLVRHGHVIAEGWWAPYRADLPHSLFSISKSFVSTAVGFAVDEGLLSIDDRVVDLLPDDLPEVVGDNLAAMRVRHLLTMTSGHSVDTVDATSGPEQNWSRAILALPVEHAPGTTFVYNTGATYLLSDILQRATGERVLDYLTPRLFEPLGIAGATWEQCPRGIDVGGWGLSITTEHIAAFGETYLRDGVFEGRQVVPAEWVRAATTLQVENGDPGAADDNTQGYGFQFWRSRHNTYRADGAFGQWSIAMPEQDALLVITSGLDDPRALNTVWDHLLPVLGGVEKAPDATGVATLADRLGTLSLALPDGSTRSLTAQRVSGVQYALPKNSLGLESVALTFDGDEARLTVVAERGTDEIVCGSERWAPGESTLLADAPAPAAAAGAWADDDSYLVTVFLTTTPFSVTLVLDFRDDEVTLTVEQNVSFGPTRLLHTVGRRV